MDNSFISRKSFLRKAAALAVLPFAASALASCGDESNIASPTDNSFDSALNAKETVSAKTLSKTGDSIQLPASVLYTPGISKGIYLVLAKVNYSGKTKMQFVQVEAKSSSNGYAVKGISQNAELFVNPMQVIVDLAGISKEKTKSCFNRPQLLKGGKI
jgi:hypothetical protein